MNSSVETLIPGIKAVDVTMERHELYAYSRKQLAAKSKVQQFSKPPMSVYAPSDVIPALEKSLFRNEMVSVETSMGEAKDTSDKMSLAKAQAYTSATGSYCFWSTEVNLGSPSAAKHRPPEDEYIRQYYEALQYTLYETGYPETIDRSKEPRRSYTTNDPTIVVLSSPVECMCLLLEGGRQCPGDMLLVLSTTWLSKEPSMRREGEEEILFSLFAHKGITCDKAGNTFIDTFDPPRRVTYFVNFFTHACTSGQRSDGEKLEDHLDCPMSSSVLLSKVIDDKLLTRILLANTGVPYPITLAFPYKSTFQYDNKVPGIRVLSLSCSEEVRNVISAQAMKFLLSPAMATFSKVVVKPSGPAWFGSDGVTVHGRTNSDGIINAACDLLKRLSDGDAILIESFCEPLDRMCPFGLDQEYTAGDTTQNSQLSYRIRATVCRNPADEAVLTSFTCGVGMASNPINGDNTVVQNLETTLRDWGILDERERQIIHADMKAKAEATMDAIIKYERTLPLSIKGTIGAQTDIIGIDFILTRKKGRISPVAIEVNSHDCTINCQIFEFINPEYSGQAVGTLLETMLNRSMKFVMRHKRVLVIGTGGISKLFIWEAARQIGIKICLIDSAVDHFSDKMVETFVHYDFTDHTKDTLHAQNIADMFRGKDTELDGCVTFWEDCVPLAAIVCEALSLVGSGVDGAVIAKTKSRTQKVLSSRTADIPHWPRTQLYASRSCRVESHMDIENAANIIAFPAVMKLEYGSSAVAVKLTNDTEQCHEHLDRVHRNLTRDSDHPGVGLGHGNAMILMDYIYGTEHDIDIVIYRRKLIAAFVSDNGPTHLPDFTETAAAMPTYLPPCKKNQLIKAAYQCCTEIGLQNGTFNVEMKMTPTGPKLLEINARMGGFYLRDWIQCCFKVDILLCSLAIACGVRPLVRQSAPSNHIVGLMLTPRQHGPALTPDNWKLLQRLHSQGSIRLNQFEESVDVQDYEEPFCNIAIVDSDREKAKVRLTELCNLLGFSTTSFPVSYYLSDFKS